MGIKPDTIYNSFTNGEVSPKSLGRFDISKYASSAEIIENFLVSQLGGVFFRPGTRYMAATKTASVQSRLLKFSYNTEQNYAIEAGNLYFRYYTATSGVWGRLESGGSPVELVTPFATANLSKIKYAQDADTQYIASGVYPVQKHTRTSATAFNIADVAFKRGPFLDTNITATTITAGADTGASVGLTASSAIFESGHVGSLWRIKNGVVKITAFSTDQAVTGTVQDEPDGTTGNLGTSGAAVTDWAEGSWSEVRGYPKVVAFHEGGLWFANTDHQPGGVWRSVLFAPENFDVGNGDDNEAINIDTSSSGIRWLVPSSKSLLAGGADGLFPIRSGSQGLPVTPSNVAAPKESDVGTAEVQAQRIKNYIYYVQNDLQKFLESGYQFDIDATDAIDTTLLADHILNAPIPTNTPGRFEHLTGGAYDIASQQSPNDRIWVVRNDGQIAVLTRNVRQEVNGWVRLTGGKTVKCDGVSGTGAFESIVIFKQEGSPDIVIVQANRIIDGSVKRFIEYFTPEDFRYEWDAVRLDCSLTLDNPLDIEDIILLDGNVLIKITAHGLSNGDRIKIDNVVGATGLNGNEYLVKDAGTDYFKIEPAT